MKKNIQTYFLAISVAALVAGAAYVFSAEAEDKPQVIETSHKALYELKTVSVDQGSSIIGVSGQMYYEQEDVCDAWTTEHRFSAEYQYPERSPVSNTNRYVSWEAKDGSLFYFNSSRQEDEKQTEQLRGSVARNDDGTAVAEYVRPEDLKHNLPKGYLLPFQHTDALVEHARKGDKFFNAVVFDGTDAEGPVAITAFIGKRATPEEIDTIAKAGKIDHTLLLPEAWHMRLSFFPLKDKENLLPAYEMNMILHANGVISDVLVDYKSFKVKQTLTALEKLPGRPCK